MQHVNIGVIGVGLGESCIPVPRQRCPVLRLVGVASADVGNARKVALQYGITFLFNV
jgi:predicted dehydrogenase